MKALSLAAAVTLLWQTAARPEPTPEPAPFSLRGIELGITIDEFRRIPHPDRPDDGYRVFCTLDKENNRKNSLIGLYLMEGQIRLGHQRCNYFVRPKGWEMYMFGQVSIANITRVTMPSFEFYRGSPSEPYRLHRIALAIGADDMEQLVRALRERYGPPQADLVEAVQNRLGAKFDVRSLTWMRPNSTISVVQHQPKIGQVAVIFTHIGLLLQIESAREKNLGKPSDNL